MWTKSMLKDGGRETDPALKDAGPRAPEGVGPIRCNSVNAPTREREGGKDHGKKQYRRKRESGKDHTRGRLRNKERKKKGHEAQEHTFFFLTNFLLFYAHFTPFTSRFNLLFTHFHPLLPLSLYTLLLHFTTFYQLLPFFYNLLPFFSPFYPLSSFTPFTSLYS